jgi:HEAT repeat protein
MKKFIMVLASLFVMAAVAGAQEAKKETPPEQKKAKTAQEYIADLGSRDENTAVDAANWLGKENEKSAIPELMKSLKNDDRPKVRMFAAVALGTIADESAVDALNEALLNDSSADVRYAAILAISRVGSTKSIDALKAAKEKETDPYIRDYMDKMEAKLKKK